MWDLRAKDGLGNAVEMVFEKMEDAVLMADTLRAEGFHDIRITPRGFASNPA